MVAAVKSERSNGTVKSFSSLKGYGFITPDNGKADLVMHDSAIKFGGFRELRQGDRVEFTTERGPKGLQAANVVRV